MILNLNKIKSDLKDELKPIIESYIRILIYLSEK